MRMIQGHIRQSYDAETDTWKTIPVASYYRRSREEIDRDAWEIFLAEAARAKREGVSKVVRKRARVSADEEIRRFLEALNVQDQTPATSSPSTSSPTP